ncbi:MAG: hypothetical protein HUU29_06405 [Planctomycetaceae bacterium]|nr:hypothetical protein [Planctomycetaceae bacterium]
MHNSSVSFLYPQSSLQAKALRLWLRMREFESLALGIDHLDEDLWNYPLDRRGKELHGGILWSNIDEIHGRIYRLLLYALPVEEE